METAFHESLHALYAAEQGWHIETVVVSAARDGFSAIALPVTIQHQHLYRAHCHNPQQARRDVVNIVACLLAPSIVLEVPVSAGDLSDLTMWKDLWTSSCSYSSGVSATMIEDEARRAVELWASVPGRAEHITRVAGALDGRGMLSGQDVLDLVRACPTPAPALPVRGGSAEAPRAQPPRPRPVAPAATGAGYPVSKPMGKEEYEKICGSWHLSANGLVCTRAPGSKSSATRP
jgi:hypothetical protein